MPGHASPEPPTYYRLSDESWAEILAAYVAGATARELSIRWRVAPGTIYRRAREAGLGKHSGAIDAAVRAQARELTAEAAVDMAGAQAPGAMAALDASPEGLLAQARLALAQTLAAGRYAEAAQCARVAASLERAAGCGGGAEDAAPAEEDWDPYGGEPAWPGYEPKRGDQKRIENCLWLIADAAVAVMAEPQDARAIVVDRALSLLAEACPNTKGGGACVAQAMANEALSKARLGHFGLGDDQERLDALRQRRRLSGEDLKVEGLVWGR